MSHKITGKEPLQKPCNCNTQDVLPSKLDIAIAEYKEMARKAEEARDEFLQMARALEDIAKETNATANKNAILAKFDDITIDTSTLAKEVQVKDGNDTAISVGKEVRSELGTGSDTAEETGTLFAVMKWVKDKVKSIYNALTDSTNGLAAIKTILNSISTNMYKGVPVVSQSGSVTISPNIWNIWSGVNADLTITKGTDISGIVNEYIIRFTLGSSWMSGTNTITFSGWSLEWNGGSVPTWTADHIYEISIVDNIALWVDITPAS